MAIHFTPFWGQTSRPSSGNSDPDVRAPAVEGRGLRTSNEVYFSLELFPTLTNFSDMTCTLVHVSASWPTFRFDVYLGLLLRGQHPSTFLVRLR